MRTQRHEIEAWLGDNHGLTPEQITDLTNIADQIAYRHRDPDEHDEREAALTVAYRLMVEDPETVVAELAAQRRAAHLAHTGLQQAAHQLVDMHASRTDRGLTTQAGFARTAGVDRMAVKRWLGLRA